MEIFKKDTKGNIRFLEVRAEGPTIVQISGILGTDNPVEHRKEAKAKNIGRANETTAEAQALKECEAIIVDKLTKGYFKSIGEAETEEVILPMLALDYFKTEKKIPDNEPLILERKLDGCFINSTLIETDQGLIPIGDIVNNRMEVKVKSYNEVEDLIEYKKVVNWFNNGNASNKDFLTLKLENGMKVTCTRNHKFYTQRGWVAAEDISTEEDFIKVSKEAENFRLIFGSFLGDGCIPMDKRYEYSSKFTMCQGQDQKEYLDHKINRLGEEFKIKERESGYGGKVYDAVMKGFYKYKGYSKLLVDNGGKKFLTKQFLNKYLNEEGLSIWIADDGSLTLNNGNKYSPVLTISTHAFEDKQLDVFIEYFTSKWGVTPVKSVDKRGVGTSLRFNTKDTLYLLNRLRGNIPPGVEYKFYFSPEVKNKDFMEGFQKVSAKVGVNGTSYTKYDIEVEDNHNYYAEGFLAHNCRLLIDIQASKNKVRLITRQGKELTTVPHVIAEAEGIMTQLQLEGVDRLILDGELYAGTSHTFQECMSLIKKEQPGQEILQYIVYDIVDTKLTYKERKEVITDLFGSYTKGFYPENKSVICAGPWNLDTKLQIRKYYEDSVSKGYEGLMVKRTKGKYKINGRSSDLLKYKEFFDIQLPLYDVIPTDADPKKGQFVFEYATAENGILRCGMKFSDKECEEFLANKDNYIGQVVEIRYFEETETGSLRFPVAHAVGFRLDK